MTLIANSAMKTTIWLPFLSLSNTVHGIHKKLFPRMKSEFQIRDFFPEKPEKSKFHKIKLPRKISLHTVNYGQVCFSNLCNLSVFVSQFQQSYIRELRKCFGQGRHCPSPKSESALTPMLTYNALRMRTLKEGIKTQRKIASHSNLTRAMLFVCERLPLNHVFLYAWWA